MQNTDNLTLKSFGAFCQKGENDIDKLEDYLISNKIGDFRIAFALWGIVFGFANMPKTLTNELFLKEDINYITLVYKHIFKQLHGIELDGKFEKTEVRKQPIETKPEVPMNRTKKEGAKPTSLNSDNQDIKQKLSDCKLKPEQLESICEVYKKNHYSINEKFFSDIKKIKGIGDKKIEKIRLALNAEIPTEKIQPESPHLFKDEDMKPELGNEFYSDSSVWYYIEPLIPKADQKKVKTEIYWIQKVHKENGYKNKKGEWIPLTDHSNRSVIKHFENNVKKRNKIDSELLERIVSKLSELYK